MFRGIEYARIVLSDITGLNANVFYELGVRHHSKPTGTARLTANSSRVRIFFIGPYSPLLPCPRPCEGVARPPGSIDPAWSACFPPRKISDDER